MWYHLLELMMLGLGLRAVSCLALVFPVSHAFQLSNLSVNCFYFILFSMHFVSPLCLQYELAFVALTFLIQDFKF